MRCVGTVELTRAGPGAIVGVDDGVGTEVDVDEAMNKEFTMEPERVLQTAPVVYLGEASRVAPFNVRPHKSIFRRICLTSEYTNRPHD